MLQAGDLAAKQDLVSALYDLAGRYMLVAPEPAMASEALPSLFWWSIRAVQLREAEAVRPVIVFLSRWIAPSSGSVLTESDRMVRGIHGAGVLHVHTVMWVLSKHGK